MVALAGTAIGLILDAGFNTDRIRVPETFDGTIHSVGTWILALGLPVAAFFFGFDFVRNSTSTLSERLVLIVGGVQLGAIVLFEMSPATLRGWAERLVAVLAVATLGLLQDLSRANAKAGQSHAVADRGPVFGLPPVSTSGSVTSSA